MKYGLRSVSTVPTCYRNRVPLALPVPPLRVSISKPETWPSCCGATHWQSQWHTGTSWIVSDLVISEVWLHPCLIRSRHGWNTDRTRTTIRHRHSGSASDTEFGTLW